VDSALLEGARLGNLRANSSRYVGKGLGILPESTLRWIEPRVEPNINHNLAKRQGYGLSHMLIQTV
jgi:hypothetical protein